MALTNESHHGSTLGWVARRLGLATGHRESVLIVGASPWSIELARTLNQLEIKVLVVDTSWHALRPARLAGLPVFYGQILSDFAEESVEIAHVGTMLAATSNDAYNSLVCTAMAPDIGRERVFQLPMGLAAEDDPRRVALPLRGKIAFDPEAVFERLWRCHVRGWTFSKTRLTENYTYSDFLGDCATDAIQILLLRSDGLVQLHSPQSEMEPQPGDTLVYYGPERSPIRSHAPAAA